MRPRFPSELALLLPANFNYVCLESMKITRIVFVGFRFSVANYFQVKKNCRHMYHIILFFLSFLFLQQLSPSCCCLRIDSSSSHWAIDYSGCGATGVNSFRSTRFASRFRVDIRKEAFLGFRLPVA